MFYVRCSFLSALDSDRSDRLRPSRGCSSRTGHGPFPSPLRARGQASPHQHPIGPSAFEGRPEPEGVGSQRIATQVFRYRSQIEETVSRLYRAIFLLFTAYKKNR